MATRKDIENRILKIDQEIGNEIVDEYHEEIVEIIKGLGGDDTSLNGSKRKQLWTILKRKVPKIKSTFPVGKKTQMAGQMKFSRKGSQEMT